MRRRVDNAVLIPVFYRAERGGLQEHAPAQALGLRKRGFRPVVVCRSGLFAESLDADGIPAITVSFHDLSDDAEHVLKAVRPVIVHAHPFRARKLGLILAERAECPLFVTFHGQHSKADDIGEWGHRLAGLVAVSEGVRDHVLRFSEDMAARTVVLPNAVDLSRYRPPRWRRQSKQLTVLVPSRFDKDKSRLIDLLIDTWKHQGKQVEHPMSWIVAGDGTQIQDLQDAASTLERTSRGTVEFLGWQAQETLRRLYRAVDACIAPGRSALESMASGTPTFAVGSKGYAGPTWSAIHAGMYSNFGGVRSVSDDGALPNDLDSFAALSWKHRVAIGKSSRAIAAAFYSQRRVDDALAALYRVHLVSA